MGNGTVDWDGLTETFNKNERRLEVSGVARLMRKLLEGKINLVRAIEGSSCLESTIISTAGLIY